MAKIETKTPSKVVIIPRPPVSDKGGTKQKSEEEQTTTSTENVENTENTNQLEK